MEKIHNFENDYNEEEFEGICFTEESVNVSNVIKYFSPVEYPFLDTNSKMNNLVSDYFNEKNTLKSYLNFDQEILNSDIIQQNLTRIKAKRFPYDINNLKISDNSTNNNTIISLKNKFKLNEESFHRINKFNFIFNENSIDENEKIERMTLKSGKNKTETAFNVFNYTYLLKNDQYFHFIVATLYLKNLNFDNNNNIKFKSSDIRKEYTNAFKTFQKCLDTLNENFSNNKDLENFLSTKNNLSSNTTEIEIGEIFMKLVVDKHSRSQNLSNCYIFDYIKLIYENPIDIDERIYSEWKLLLGRLVTIWDFKNISGLNQKIGIKYLKLKFVILKLFKNKEKGYIYSFKNDNNVKDILTINNLFSVVKEGIEGADDFPRCTHIKHSFLTYTWNALMDISIIYFLIILPLLFILDTDLLLFYSNYTDHIFNGIYFFNILRNFRSLILDEMNVIQKDLSKRFKSNIGDILLYLDIISLLPFDTYACTGNPDNLQNTYYIQIKYLVLLRIFRFGQFVEFLDSTKYAVFFRLMRLMLQFVIYVHWCGIFLIVLLKNEFYSTSWTHDESCKTYDSVNKLSSYCLFTEALYSGAFLAPGKNVNNVSFFSKFRLLNEYLYFYSVFFVGQIITATVFSSVYELILSMNKAENTFQEIKDNHRIQALYYKFDNKLFKDVQLYYEYIWLKHRENIYGLGIFENLSTLLRKRLAKAMIPSYKYLLKDFIVLSKKDNKFIDMIINNITKYIAFPYERIVSQGHVIKGLFIISNGTVYFDDEPTKNVHNKNTRKYRVDLKGEISLSNFILNEKMRNIQEKTNVSYDKEKVIFPLDSLYIKTGRGIQTYYSTNFTDLFLLSLDKFDNHLIRNYPNEMYDLAIKAKEEGMHKLGKDNELLSIVLKHSSRSTGAYYEDEYNLNNMWIEIKRLMPKYKLKVFTLANKLDIIGNMSNSYGLFEIGHKVNKFLLMKLDYLDNNIENNILTEKLKKSFNSFAN